MLFIITCLNLQVWWGRQGVQNPLETDARFSNSGNFSHFRLKIWWPKFSVPKPLDLPLRGDGWWWALWEVGKDLPLTSHCFQDSGILGRAITCKEASATFPNSTYSTTCLWPSFQWKRIHLVHENSQISRPFSHFQATQIIGHFWPINSGVCCSLAKSNKLPIMAFVYLYAYHSIRLYLRDI